MSSDFKNMDDTLINMITNLQPNFRSESRMFNFTSRKSDATPKRSFSSSNDSIELLLSAKKPKLELKCNDVKYASSPREVSRMRSDLIEARNTITDLESRVQHMHNVRKEMQIMFDNETESLQRQHQVDNKSIEQMEMQLQSVRKREATLKDQLLELTGKYDTHKLTTDKHTEELEKKIFELTDELKSFKDIRSKELIDLTTSVAELKGLLSASEEKAETCQKINEELEKQLSTKNEIERTLEMKEQSLQKAQLLIKDFEYARETYIEFQQQAKAQQYKLANYGELEKENQRLKDENKRIKNEIQNKLVLEEEVNDLKFRLVNYKEQETKLAVLQTAQVENEMQLNEWRAVARGICESNSSNSSLPRILQTLVEKLQQREIILTSEKVQLESQLSTAVHDSKVARAELEKIQKHMTELSTNTQQRQSLIHRMQKKLLLVTRERDSYRLQLDSYERDLTMCFNSSNAQAGSNQQQGKHDRIENLEKLIQEYRDMVSRLESELEKHEPALHSDTVPIRTEQLNRLKEEIDRLKNDNDQLRDRKNQLEIQLENVLVGQDIVKGRVLHRTRNPLADCVAQEERNVDKMQQEIEKLKRKVKTMEAGLEGSKLSDSLMCPKEVQALKDQIKMNATQMQRLKDYFKTSMQEFRNVIYLLMGYKIDKISSAQYKLISMYADNPDDQICFQLYPDGHLNILENEFTSTLTELVELHLKHQNSIPVFLSALTVDLFNNRSV